MNARVKENGHGFYIIQYKRIIFSKEMPWWTTLKGMEAWGTDIHTYTLKFDTLEEATQEMIKVILDDKRKKENKKKTAVVAEVTTEQVQEKFPEFFI